MEGYHLSKYTGRAKWKRQILRDSPNSVILRCPDDDICNGVDPIAIWVRFHAVNSYKIEIPPSELVVTI